MAATRSQAEEPGRVSALAAALRAASRALTSQGVRFALTGGIAVNVWGRQRLTTDVDLAVAAADPEALRQMVQATQRQGFLALDPRPMTFDRAWVGRLALDPDAVAASPQPVIVDLIRPIGRGAAAWLESLLARAVSVTVLGEPLPVVCPEDLVLFKLMVPDRGYDRDDARSVLAESGPALDRAYLVEMARRLGLRTKLRRLGV